MRLIDADALLNDPANISSNEFGDDVVYVEDINKAPTVERPRGEWIFSGVEHTADNPIDSDSYYCSICKRSISTSLTRPEELFPFCHCGADMRKRGEAE